MIVAAVDMMIVAPNVARTILINVSVNVLN